ncbi:MAG: NAD(P)-dependent oxidoreductase [Desulfobacterales bacterium]|nr:NAD(P)-dependent oxidoreductase [Desulfobacterales bacterium]
MHRYGFVGLGQMGKWMAANLLQAGFDLTVCDLDPEAIKTLADLGAESAPTPAELSARVDTIFLSLPHQEVVYDVVCGAGGILEQARSGSIIVDCGTTDYLWTIDFAEEMGAEGIDFVDAPVTGMEQRARAATLTIMFGGSQRLLEKIRPALDAMGNRIVHMGDVGSGQLAKLVNQLLFNTHMAALAEVLPMAVKLGLDPERIAKVINTGSGRSFASETFLPHILEGRFTHGYSMGNAYKDMAGGLRISAANRIPLPVVQAATATYQRALRSGCENQDKGAMIKLFESLLGVVFRKSQFK